MAIERRRIIFSGRVQGVGFRATTSWVACGFDVAGHVRNLPDGTVEIVAEAEPGEIDRFVEAVRERMSDFVRGVDSAPLAPGGPPLSGFRVRA
ncbi:acylphosphatase [Paludisphaera sp.]|uniref:acylphosphatase n=1 Tax=Paludisphaera sp. TaxID=2017432 RepID=UPI00301CF1FA